MSDLQELWAWHEAEGCRFAEFMAGEDQHELSRVRIHRETAKILRLLDRVRSECSVSFTPAENGPLEWSAAEILVSGPPDLLLQFAERLKRD